MRVLFVCHGNICRSPMAEFVLKDLAKKARRDDLIIASAGTSTEELGRDAHHGTKKELKAHNIEFFPRHARQVAKNEYENWDIFVVMDSANKRNLERIFGGDPQGKITKMMSFVGSSADVADPWYTGNFELTFSDIYKACKALLEQI
ncbi:low molecular weight protein-tyrosine-phosphatase [Campylobacter sp.]|uniref:low molecular weight protein-tyrosine-phosphatase n=1 Tax=Campylobacter sp. TaxID=205 RepID=UPI002A4EA1E9|nr:low molecular weight protein-tyrosine-phosphatase [Campylobacter sp.]MCI6661134.1 low molecular weight phosphotyrosine protein phosphatase [Campylobacter sp.]MCI7549012.1 low molecular weight phosphotyrosine protein phosphatase [Campylobacter sp.]MDD7091687.1 low molecular weight phosphotyrosine protein phosphatase [Campylobacteraceae bacterium]MDY5284602.1 low molecular weight protein-tyrosine-phosphatase [Campylobacter sp.]